MLFYPIIGSVFCAASANPVKNFDAERNKQQQKKRRMELVQCFCETKSKHIRLLDERKETKQQKIEKNKNLI